MSIGGRRQNNQQREEILQLFLQSPEDARQLAISRGLAHDYAYKLANARGVLPRERKHWGKHREVHA